MHWTFGRHRDDVEVIRQQPSVAELPGDIHVASEREEVPVFKRIYTAVLNERATIKITCHTFIGSRFRSGELTQPNGRWILFDVEAIADKILDPTLVPLVQRYTDQIVANDQAFLDTDPTEYKDSHGKTWKRV